MGINLNAVQKFWSVKFISMNARSTTVHTLITIIYAPYSKVRGAFISELSPFLSDKKKSSHRVQETTQRKIDGLLFAKVNTDLTT